MHPRSLCRGLGSFSFILTIGLPLLAPGNLEASYSARKQDQLAPWSPGPVPTPPGSPIGGQGHLELGPEHRSAWGLKIQP